MTDNLVQGKIDFISKAGTVEGWSIDGNTKYPCHVQIRLENSVIAEDISDKFRPDLLEAGLGHGHYAFYAQIKSLDAGVYPLRLFDGKTGVPIGHYSNHMSEVPERVIPPKKTIEALLLRRGSWQDKDIIANPACLQLDLNYAHFGLERFVDRVFRFALGRWADPAAMIDYCELLARQKMTPTENLLAVLGSVERQTQNRQLARPSDPDFPFIYDPESVVRAFLSAQAIAGLPADLAL